MSRVPERARGVALEARRAPGRRFRRAALLLTVGAAAAGCAAGTGAGSGAGASPDPPDAPAAATPAGAAGARADTLPVGRGTLREAEVSVTLRAGPLLVRMVPLDESVLRLTAPDTYRRLRATATGARDRLGAARAAREPSLFLVTLFSRSAEVAYEPEALRLGSRGRSFRPVAIDGLTARWGEGRLRQEEVQSAVYAFPSGVDLASPDLVIRYGESESREWERVLRRLEVERSRVRGRAGG